MDRPQRCRELVDIAGMSLDAGWARLQKLIDERIKTHEQICTVIDGETSRKRKRSDEGSEPPEESILSSRKEGIVSRRKVLKNLHYICRRSTELYKIILVDATTKQGDQADQLAKIHTILGDLRLFSAVTTSKAQEKKALARCRTHYLSALATGDHQVYFKLAFYASRCEDVLCALICSLRGVLQGAQPPCIPRPVLCTAEHNDQTRPLTELLQNEKITQSTLPPSPLEAQLLAIVLLMLYSVDDRIKTIPGTEFATQLLSNKQVHKATKEILEGRIPSLETHCQLQLTDLVGSWRADLSQIPLDIQKLILQNEAINTPQSQEGPNQGIPKPNETEPNEIEPKRERIEKDNIKEIN